MNSATRHLCMIYDGPPSKSLSLLVPMLVDRLATRHRCAYLGNPVMVARMRAALSKAGVDVPEAMMKGALILTADQGHLKNGEFHIDAMLEYLSGAVDKAVEDGYRGLWASGDMTWEFGSENNLGKLLQYEYELENVFRTKPMLEGICQYHKDTLPLRILGDALLTHPQVYLNHTLHVNRFYAPPENLPEATSALQERDVEWMLQHFEIS